MGFSRDSRNETAGLVPVTLTITGLLALALLLIGFSLGLGSEWFLPWQAWLEHNNGQPMRWLVLTEIRLPRVLLALLVGAGLAAAGVVMQGVVRNPLADPGLLGISAGAAAGAACVLLPAQLFWPALSLTWLLPVGAALGALGFAGFILLLSERFGWQDNTPLVLSGLALNALAMAVVGALLVVADPLATRELLFWNLGSLARADYFKLGLLLLLLLPSLWFWWWRMADLDVLALGDQSAAAAGVDARASKRWLLVSLSLVTGCCVALTGIIGFVGLVVPHMVRLLIGPRHRLLLVFSVVFGALFLLAVDTVARTLILPAELPIGVVTAVIGAPFFLWLIAWRSRGAQ